MTGYREAMADRCDVIVKIDGDGQMDPLLLPQFVRPILEGRADYTKGNRFFNPEDVRTMPPIRLFGNAVLSFMTKLSSSYWNLFDPTNGYTAIHARLLPASGARSDRSTLCLRSDAFTAWDNPRCGNRCSHGRGLWRRGKPTPDRGCDTALSFWPARNFGKQLVYNYFLRDFSIASIELVAGLGLFGFGIIFGLYHWVANSAHDTVASSGTVMLAALPIILGLSIAAVFPGLRYNVDTQRPIHPLSAPEQGL